MLYFKNMPYFNILIIIFMVININKNLVGYSSFLVEALHSPELDLEDFL